MTRTQPTTQTLKRGARGGQTTAERHGPAHFEAIGKLGFETSCDRYHGGDVDAYMAFLRSRKAVAGAVQDEALGCRVLKLGSFEQQAAAREQQARERAERLERRQARQAAKVASA